MGKGRIDQIQEKTSRILQIVVRFAAGHNIGRLTLETYKDSNNKVIADLCHDITSIANESLMINDRLRLEENLDKIEKMFVRFQVIGLELGYDISIKENVRTAPLEQFSD